MRRCLREQEPHGSGAQERERSLITPAGGGAQVTEAAYAHEPAGQDVLENRCRKASGLKTTLRPWPLSRSAKANAHTLVGDGVDVGGLEGGLLDIAGEGLENGGTAADQTGVRVPRVAPRLK